jgi:hypothetical protein
MFGRDGVQAVGEQAEDGFLEGGFHTDFSNAQFAMLNSQLKVNLCAL